MTTTDWPVDWESNRREQRRAIARATATQRLRWLESAVRLAHETGALAAANADPHRRRRRGLREGEP